MFPLSLPKHPSTNHDPVPQPHPIDPIPHATPDRSRVSFNVHIHRSPPSIDRAIDIDRPTRSRHPRGYDFECDRRRIGTFAHDDVDDDDDDDRAPDGDARATHDRGARCGCASDDGATGT
jgi:hypothetical protein